MRRTDQETPVIREKVAGVALAAPAIVVVVLLFLVPFGRSFLASFRNDAGQWTFNNYGDAFTLYGVDLLFTLGICLGSLILLVLLSVTIGGLLRLHASPVLEFLFKIPLFVPFVVVGHAMRVFLAPHGTLNSALTVFGWFDPDRMPSIAFSSFGLIAALVWKNLGISLLLVLGGFRSVHESLLEAARGLGAGGMRQIWNFLVPINKGSIGVMAILTFTSMLGCFSIPAMIGNAEGPQMLMVDLYYQKVYQNNNGLASAIGVISYIASLGAAIYYLRGLSRR